MKKIVLLFCLILGGIVVAPKVSAGVQNFYFEDFSGDYYLTKDEEGVSRLKVVEKMTAVFPDYNQNKGICRQIPFTNQDGKNITLPRLTRDDIKVTRNGVAEPIYSIEKEGNYYNVCTGTDEYVLGKQVYELEYEFSKVVTEFTQDGREFQELYWDTNGNGWQQKFNMVTARLHFENPDDYTGKSWCYVGKFGESGQERCTIKETSDGVEFVAKDLAVRENLTFDVELKPGSFVVPAPEENMIYYWLMAAVIGLCGLCVLLFLKKYLKTRAKEEYYKSIFVKPEYQPSKKYGLTEMVEIYLGKKKDVKVAMLLEMIVQHKIELEKIEKRKWNIIVNEEVDGEYGDLLAIINGGGRPNKGDVIEVKRHKATTKLIGLKSAMENKILARIKKDQLVENKYRIGDSKKRGVANVIAMTIVLVPMIIVAGFFLLGLLEGVLDLHTVYDEGEKFCVVAFVAVTITTAVCTYLSDKTQKFENYTNKGLEASKYMEGLEMYIRMAEADRMKMLQSVKGVDVSASGIVKLYEKLLPYAAVFGLEESWMNEMKEYCEVEEIGEPDYLTTGLAISEITRITNNVANYATAATVMSSSGGGASSGFSGGGGGGFSGGGGGGGGGGGR